MALTGLLNIVGPAAAADRGAGAFNVISVEHAEGIVAGAQAAGLPVILQISENCVRYHGGLAAIADATLAVARAAPGPVAVHLDHATDEDLVRAAVGLGLGSVMYDTSARPYQSSVAATRTLTDWCHARGVAIEAELGEIGGKDGVHSPAARTRPDEAAAFAAATGVDALAVAVGSSHAMLTRDAVLDLDLIRDIRAVVPVPLVLHGSSGVPDQALAAAVAAGLTKVNIGTQLNKVFTAAVREALGRNPAMTDPRQYLAGGREAVGAEVSRLLRIIS
jgi:fructose-bisphosphate aldolase class II